MFKNAEKRRAAHLHADLCNIYEGEVSVLSKDIKTIQQEILELKLNCESQLADERREQKAMLLEMEELKEELERAEALQNRGVGAEGAACAPPALEELLRELGEVKRKHLAEKEVLTAELSVTKRNLEDLNRAREREKSLRSQAEAEKQEAVEIATALFKKLEDLPVSDETSAKKQAKEDELRLEIEELQRMLQEEHDWRDKAEAEGLKQFKIIEDFCDEFNEKIKNEQELRAEAERKKLEADNISEAFLKNLEEARTITKKLSAKTQKLADQLEAEKRKQDGLIGDIEELAKRLDKEKELRIQAEDYEIEAVEMVENLERKIEKIKTRFSTRMRSLIRSRFSVRTRSEKTRAAP